MRPQLRLYTGEDSATMVAEPPIPVRLGEISEALADAVLSRRTWLSDFAEEEIQISADLYEVLSAYWHLRPSA